MLHTWPTTLIAHWLWTANAFNSKNFNNICSYKLDMLKFNMPLHKTYPKRLLVCNNPFSPFVFFSTKVGWITCGKQVLHYNCWTSSQFGMSTLFTTRKAHGTYLQLWIVQNLACLCKVNKGVIWSSSLVVEFWVFILKPLDEDNVPLLYGRLHWLTWTKCTSITSTSKGNEAKVSHTTQCCSFLAIV